MFGTSTIPADRFWENRVAENKPLCQFGALSCFCSYEPEKASGDFRAAPRSSEEGEHVFEADDATDALQRAKAAKTGSRSRSPFRQAANSSESQADSTAGLKLEPRSVPESDVSTGIGTPPKLRSDPQAAVQCPPLEPVGCGGWHVKADVTEDMREVAVAARSLFEEQEGHPLGEFGMEFLTSVTLVNYVNPMAPQHLVNALVRRCRNERILTGKEPVYLASSMRIVGWDGEGASVVAAEPSTLRRSFHYTMPQVEYVGWTAFDLNKPGASGFTVFQDFGGGFNPFHFLNPKPILDLAAMVEGQWRRRLKVAMLIDMPASFRSILNLFLGFVKPATRSKIKVLDTMEDALQELAEMGCDEETLTNTRKFMLARRQRLSTQRWHPLVDYSFFRDRLSDLHLSQDTLYVTEDIHRRFREAIQEFRVQRWGAPHTSIAGSQLGGAQTRGGASQDWTAEQDGEGTPQSVPSAVASQRSVSSLLPRDDARAGETKARHGRAAAPPGTKQETSASRGCASGLGLLRQRFVDFVLCRGCGATQQQKRQSGSKATRLE